MSLFAKKSLGQHFLNSTHVLDQIIEASHIQNGEVVLEIGPGTGILTGALLRSGACVIAVEKDIRAQEILQEKFAHELNERRLTIIQGDILTLDIATLIQGPYALVANIPYYITGAILEKFLEYEPRPNRMVLLVQKEVAERIIARDGKESVLSISVKAFGTPTLVAKVPPGAFTPPPTVDSAILAINGISASNFSEKGLNIRVFFELLKAGFAHKRKFLIRNIEDVMNKQRTLKAWDKLGINPKVRAEEISVKTWIDIATCE